MKSGSSHLGHKGKYGLSEQRGGGKKKRGNSSVVTCTDDRDTCPLGSTRY